MADFFTRLAQRSLGQFPTAQPVIAPRFGRVTPEPENPGFEILLNREQRREVQAGQSGNIVGREISPIPPPVNFPGRNETPPLQNSQPTGFGVTETGQTDSDTADSLTQASGTIGTLEGNDAPQGSQTFDSLEVTNSKSPSIRRFGGPILNSPSANNFNDVSRSELPGNESFPESVTSEGPHQHNVFGQGSPEGPPTSNAGGVGNGDPLDIAIFDGSLNSDSFIEGGRERPPSSKLEGITDSESLSRQDLENSIPNHGEKFTSIPFPDFQNRIGSLPSLAAQDAELPTEPEIQPQPRTIKVTIGRVDVRAIQPKPPPQPKPAPSRPRPAVSLNDYLKQRSRGGP